MSPAIERILEAARWAPSGDNSQPWTFEVCGENDLTVSIRPSLGNVYEFRQGEPTLISAGTLLENIAIAAPAFGKHAHWRYLGAEDGSHRIGIKFEDGPAAQHPLHSHIWQRSVDRRAYRMRPLPAQSRSLLTEAAGADVSVEWFESLKARHAIATLAHLATGIRLRLPEAFPVHRRMVDWKRLLSPDAIPAGTFGLDAVTTKLMHWSFGDWKRSQFLNRLGSPIFAGLQMDVLPGLFSSAYFAFRMPPASGRDDRVSQILRAGQALQRFWLTATRLGLAMQPCLAMLAFTHYGLTEEPFTDNARERRVAARIARKARAIFARPEELVFVGRLGFPRPRKVESRSVRLPLAGKIREGTPVA